MPLGQHHNLNYKQNMHTKLIKIGAKVVCHSGKRVFQMAEVAVPRELFRAILLGIDRLRQPLGAGG